MTRQISDGSAPRYERKYLVPTHCLDSIDNLLKLHPAFFSKIYQPRIINNVYFDNHQLDSYFDNLNGYGYRIKNRVRWYSQEFCNSEDYTNLSKTNNDKKLTVPHLEIKKRSGDLITKYLYSAKIFKQILEPVVPQSIQTLYLLDEGQKLENDLGLAKADSKQMLSLLKIRQYRPIIVNSYKRHYYLSANKKLRATIDTEIRFHEILGQRINWDRCWQLPATILELKADLKHDPEIAKAAKYLPLPLTKSSKYVLGVMSCLPDIESPLYNISVQPRLVHLK